MTKFLNLAMTLLVTSFVLGACASPTTHDSCAGWRPIRPQGSDVDKVSSELAHQIVAHNRFGQNHCGWKP